jgi:hypothetical protein
MVSTKVKKILEEIKQLSHDEQKEIIRAIEQQEPSEKNKISEEEKILRFKLAAGGWSDLIPDNFLDEIYKQRRISNRPEVEL